MIKIKAVDEQNILDVCRLKTGQDTIPETGGGCSRCNAISIAEATCHPEMHPNAIYQNNALIGFFVYQRTESEPDTAVLCRFMLDDRFREHGNEEKAFAHILRGLKIQGVKTVIFVVANENESAKKLCCSFGFRFTGETDKTGCRYRSEL